jgi:hypothetical protein
MSFQMKSNKKKYKKQKISDFNKGNGNQRKTSPKMTLFLSIFQKPKKKTGSSAKIEDPMN